MRHWLVLFAGMLVAALIWAQGEGGKQIPKEDWTEGGVTYNLPRWCQAEDANGWKKNCGVCDMKCGETSNYKCASHCRKGACACAPKCIPTGRLTPDRCPKPSRKVLAE